MQSKDFFIARRARESLSGHFSAGEKLQAFKEKKCFPVVSDANLEGFRWADGLSG